MDRKRTIGKLLFAALLVAALLAPGAALAQPAAGAERAHVLVGFTQTPGASEQALVRGLGGEIKYTYHLVPAIAASLPAAAVTALQRSPNVTVVEPDLEVYALDAELDAAWGVKLIGSGTVHDQGITGAGVKVAVIDSGIDYTHPQLAPNYAGGYDFVNNDPYPMDDNGHGTHVAGTIAAVDDGVGVVGVAPQARLYALKVLGANGSGDFSDVIAALQWAVDNGIQVTNNSYGSSTDPGTLTHQAFDNADAAGILDVAAAGNSGNLLGTGDNVGYPAAYASVVAVAATDSSDVRAYFSSTGPAVELAAPGYSIYSTYPGGYATMSGTSMASPHVAGAAALVFSAKSTLTNDDVRATLAATALDLGAAGRDTWYGYGRIDVAAAVAAVAPVTPPAPAVNVTVTTDQASYVNGPDAQALVSVIVTDELGHAIGGLLPAAFATTLDGDPVGELPYAEGPAGTYTLGLPLANLPDGTHTVAVTVTDTRGLGDTGSASFTVTTPGTLPPVRVSAITYATIGGGKHLNVTVAVVDGQGSPVAGASVSAGLYRNGVLVGSYTGTTNSGGLWTFGLKNAPAGTYTTVITALSAAGLEWDGLTPPNSFTK